LPKILLLFLADLITSSIKLDEKEIDYLWSDSNR